MAPTSKNELDEPIVEANESEKSKRKFPSYIDLAAIFGVYIITQIIAVLISKVLISSMLADRSEAIQIGWLMMGVQVISMSLTIIFIHIIRRIRQAEPISIKFSIAKGIDPTTLLGGFLMILSASVAIEPLLALLPSPPQVVGRGWPMLVSVIIGAPLFEEYICRGVIFESLRQKSGVVVAWLLSSLLFGLMHLEPTMVLNAFVMGLILCYIYIRSESILTPIILHALNNALALIFILAGFDENMLLRDLISSNAIYYSIYALSIVILLISIFVCRKRFKELSVVEGESLTESEDEPADQEG